MVLISSRLDEEEEEEGEERLDVRRSRPLKRLSQATVSASPFLGTLKTTLSSRLVSNGNCSAFGLLYLELTKRPRHAALVKAAERLGWEVTESRTKGHVIWADTAWTISIFYHPLQRFNHFPGVNELSRKDLLAKNLRRMRDQFPDDYDIFPETWVLPTEAEDWRKHSELHGGLPFYIVKPWNGSEGQGISLTQVPHVVASHLSPQVTQVYVQDPLTIDGLKLDLRIYVLVTSVCPLRVYMYADGLTRFATTPYARATKDNMANHFLHLTNYTINKESAAYSRDELRGSKRRFSTLNRQLEARGADAVAMWRRIDAAVVKCVLAALPKLQALYERKHRAGYPVVPACFELLGFDVLLTRDLRPLVLEVNFLPSLHTNTAVDQAVKVPMLADVLNMVNPNAPTLRRLIRETQKFSFQLFQSRFASKKATSCAESENTRELWESFCEEKVKEVAEFEMSQRGQFRRIYPPPDDARPGQLLTTEKVLDFLMFAASADATSLKSSFDAGDGNPPPSQPQLQQQQQQQQQQPSSASAARQRSLSRAGRTCSSSSVLRDPKGAGRLGQDLSVAARAKLERNGSMPDVTESTPTAFGGRLCVRHSLRRASMMKQASLPAMYSYVRSSSCGGSSSLGSVAGSCCSTLSSSSLCSCSCSSSSSSSFVVGSGSVCGFVPSPISEREENARLDSLSRRSQLLAGLRVRERLKFLKQGLENPVPRLPLDSSDAKLRLLDVGDVAKPPCPIGIKSLELNRRPAPPRTEKRKSGITNANAGGSSGTGNRRVPSVGVRTVSQEPGTGRGHRPNVSKTGGRPPNVCRENSTSRRS